jgi:GMP synthase-like glutamine amidotransferase
MRIHCLQHVPFEGPAAIADWAAKRGHSLVISRLYAGEALPSPDVFDWLLIMGGPMNIYQELQYPWLAAEKACIDQALAADKTLLGICLGAQLLADRLGSPVYAGPEREIGWWPLSLTEAGRQSRLFGDLDEPLQAYHWHGDTFELPSGSVGLASSSACAQQAFLYDQRVLGLQFHFEVTADSMRRLIDHCGEDIVPGSYVQSAEQMLAAPPAVFERLHETLYCLLDRLASVGQSANRID